MAGFASADTHTTESRDSAWLLGTGGVWPVAALFGALTAASAALGAWLAAWVSGSARPWFVLDWLAEHALWGTLAGALLTVVLRLGARFDPSLSDLGRRRAAVARLTVLCVGLGLLALTALLAGSRGEAWSHIAIELAGAGLGLGLAFALLARCLAGSLRFEALPGLDPLRTAVLLAVVTLPLAAGPRRAPLDAPPPRMHAGIALWQLPASLPAAWQVMLGR